MNIIKSSGQREKFNPDKIRYSLERIGVDSGTAQEIADDIKRKSYNGIKSNIILKNVITSLKRINPVLAAKYNLKQAIMNLGPTGYTFEKYFAGLLRENGYKTEVGRILMGRCVEHEIDIIAEKKEIFSMVECKYHNTAGIKSDVKIALYVYARFLDLKESDPVKNPLSHKLNNAILATNTKCTTEAIKFSECRGLKIISWRYPEKINLQNLIERKNIYPITILFSLDKRYKNIFFKNDIIFIQDLIKANSETLSCATGLSVDYIQRLKKEAKTLVE